MSATQTASFAVSDIAMPGRPRPPLFERIGAWMRAGSTRAELERLSDHQLADIGLTRHEIRDALVRRRF